MQTKNKVQSVRTCLYSNKEYPKQELIRFVKVKNKLVIDKEQNMLGRGYYLKITEQVLKDPKLIQILSKRTRTNVTEELIKDLQN